MLTKMLSLDEIKKYYPQGLYKMPVGILREYFQYKILGLIFDSKYAHKLCFIGGTSLRIIYGNQRFSEDLDFDNFDLSIPEFEEIITYVSSGLEYEGIKAEIKNIYKGAYHCYIKIPDVLFDNELTSHKTEKILIKIDTYGQGHKFEMQKNLINQFDVTTSINVAPLSLILSHKLCTIFSRKTAKGRDFYDIIFILGQTRKPDRKYLKKNLKVVNSKDLKQKIIELSNTLNFEELYDDIKPFLFNPNDKRILRFKEVIEQTEFEK